MRWITSAGVPVGATTANQPMKSKPGSVSEIDGVLSKPGSLLSELTPSARSCPCSMSAAAEGTASTTSCTRPASASCAPCGMVAYGTWTILVPARLLNQAVSIPEKFLCPSVAASSLPGSALASAISSGSVFAARPGLASRKNGLLATIDTGTKSRAGSYGNDLNV